MNKLDKGLVSIIVPVYNVEKYIETCLKSILNQTYKNIEVIVVDDGSPDNSKEIVLKYASEDERIKYVKRENGGLGAARNTGIKNCTGEYICFIDSDDWIAENYVELLVDQLCKDDSDIAICNMQYIFSDGSVRKRTPQIKERECIDRVEALKREFIGKQYRFHAPNKFCKTKLFKENNIWFTEGKLYEDVSTTYKVLLRAQRVSLLDEDLYFYLQSRAGSIMHAKANAKRFLDMFHTLDEIISNQEICTLGVERELQSLYVSNVISLANYIYPMVGRYPYREVREFYRYISADKNRKLMKGMSKNPTTSKVNKIRVFFIYHCFYLYCWMMRFVDFMRRR